MEPLLRILNEEKLPSCGPDIVDVRGRSMACKQRLALAIAKNTEVQLGGYAALDDPAEFLDALVGGKTVDAELDKQFKVYVSYPSYGKRLEKLAQIGFKHAQSECALVGLNVILKAFDFFDDHPKDDTVEAFERVLWRVHCKANCARRLPLLRAYKCFSCQATGSITALGPGPKRQFGGMRRTDL